MVVVQRITVRHTENIALMVEEMNAYRVLVGKPNGKILLDGFKPNFGLIKENKY
jgi:hypothetical protein